MSRLVNCFAPCFSKTYDLKGASLGLGCTFNQRLFEWHRCEIQSIVKSNAYVMFIDTGETDLVPLKSVKFLKVSLGLAKMSMMVSLMTYLLFV